MKDAMTRMIRPSQNLYTTVKCHACGQYHDIEDETFIAIHGNVTIGYEGSVIGNNLDHKEQVVSATIFCRKAGCYNHMLNLVKGLTQNDDGTWMTRDGRVEGVVTLQ